MYTADELGVDDNRLEAEAWRALAREQRAALHRTRSALENCHATMSAQAEEIRDLKAMVDRCLEQRRTAEMPVSPEELARQFEHALSAKRLPGEPMPDYTPQEE